MKSKSYIMKKQKLYKAIIERIDNAQQIINDEISFLDDFWYLTDRDSVKYITNHVNETLLHVYETGDDLIGDIETIIEYGWNETGINEISSKINTIIDELDHVIEYCRGVSNVVGNTFISSKMDETSDNLVDCITAFINAGKHFKN